MGTGASSFERLVTILPAEEVWTISGIGGEVRAVADLLADASLIGLLCELREWTTRPVIQDAQTSSLKGFLGRLACRISERITHVLLTEADQAALSGWTGGCPVRLTVRVEGPSRLADPVLALPWELINLGPGVFPVREGRVEVIREAVVEGAPDLPEPVGSFAVAALIAAPEDRTPVSYEEEAFRLQAALSGLGQRAAFADLGGVGDLVDLVDGCGAAAIHFSGGGQGGRLLFEDGLGFADEVEIAETMRRLRTVLLDPGRAGSFPRLFLLSARGGGPEGPSTAPALHRAGFRQVVGWFGPADGELCTRMEETFYGSLATGGTVLEAVRKARMALTSPVGESGERSYPLGWAQLAVYHRGPDTPLSLPGEGAAPPLFRRRTVEVSGLPVLEQGFIGRRGQQHEARRRVHEGQRLLVFQGLGGLGKTALASQLVSRVFAPEAPDQLILRCAEVDDLRDAVAELRAQAEQHGRDHGFAYWDERTRDLRERFSDPATGFGEVIRALRRDRPNLVLYADNAESLQAGPSSDDPEILGSWRPGVEPWWREMERLADDGVLVLASTRYAWSGLGPRSHLGVGPLIPADSLRMIDSFSALQDLPLNVRTRLAAKVDGHPRTIEFLDRLIALRRAELGAEREIGDAWREIVEPVLPEQAEQIRADLLLEKLWERLSEPAREHARSLTVLRRPAPVFVIDRMGEARDELIRAGLLTRYRERVNAKSASRRHDRWGLLRLAKDFIESRTGGAQDLSAHQAAAAWEAWLGRPNSLRGDQQEAIYHLQTIHEGDRAWPIVLDHVIWLCDRAGYRESRRILEAQEAVGATGDAAVLCLLLLAQVRREGGERGNDLNQLLHQALGRAPSPARRRSILLELGSLLRDEGSLTEAERILREALASKEEGPSSDVAILNSLAGDLELQGRFLEAEELLQRALSQLDEGREPGISAHLSLQHNLARVLEGQGKYKEAEGLLRKSLGDRETSQGTNHPYATRSRLQLAEVLHRQARYVEEEDLLRRSLEATHAVLGADHPDSVLVLQRLGKALARQGRLEEAETVLRGTLLGFERIYGPDHVYCIPSLQSLAAAREARGHYRDAEGLLRRALALAETALGRESLAVATVLHDLARVVKRLRRSDEARVLLERTLAIRESRLGPEHPDVGASLHELAGAFAAQGRPEEAEVLLRRALSIFEVTMGRQHPFVGSAFHALAVLMESQGKTDEAEEFFRHALDLKRQALEPNHPDLCPTLASLAVVLARKGQEREAEMLISEALQIAINSYGEDGVDTIRIRGMMEYIHKKPTAKVVG